MTKQEDKVWVEHPQMGDVSFTRMTARQEDVLREYSNLKSKIEELKRLTSEFPNDYEFGLKVREILRK